MRLGMIVQRRPSPSAGYNASGGCRPGLSGATERTTRHENLRGISSFLLSAPCPWREANFPLLCPDKLDVVQQLLHIDSVKTAPKRGATSKAHQFHEKWSMRSHGNSAISETKKLSFKVPLEDECFLVSEIADHPWLGPPSVDALAPRSSAWPMSSRFVGPNCSLERSPLRGAVQLD